MKLTEPWSKKHKAVTKHGGLPHNLSNSFAQPLTMGELLRLTRARGDEALLALYEDHDLGYRRRISRPPEAIAELYGPSVGADDVVVFTGAQVALQTAALALVDETAHAIAFAPGYQSVLEAPVHAGAAVTSIPLSPANGWAVDVAAVLNQPYNPAGTLLPKDVFAARAGEHGIWVLCDEVYRLLEHDADDRLPARARRRRRRSSPVERNFTALMVLRASDAILEKNLAIIRENVALVDAFVAKYADHFEWVRPQPRRRAAGAGISVKPAYCFTADANIPAAHDGFRVGFGEAKMPAALEALAAFVEARFVKSGVV
ncbi:transferase [Aureococcus anophagefferens]|nr:transferase [Aureococcus anophagefferens]